MSACRQSSAQGRFNDELGIWIRNTRSHDTSFRPALFLDRDGVIVEDQGYLCRCEDVVLLPGAASLIALANRRGVPVVQVTNQSGIGRGYYGWDEFREVERALTRQLASSGATIDAVFACPYHPDGVPLWAHPAHPARKPRAGMFLAAQQFANVDLQHSWIVGDKMEDLLAGYYAGLSGGLHVLTGHGPEHREAVRAWHPPEFRVLCDDSIKDAAGLIDLLSSVSR
jgi:D-glycero-D-manno-heptose 1,7-bisphosphate phosphatase